MNDFLWLFKGFMMLTGAFVWAFIGGIIFMAYYDKYMNYRSRYK